MQRICPFLALDEGGRTVVDGYDASHRCRSAEVAEPVDRARQASVCLVAEHRACERYLAALQPATPATWPAAAPDTRLVQTRLILPASPARGLMRGAAIGGHQRRWLLGAGLATIGVAAIASGVAGGLGGLVATAPSPSGSATPASTGPAVGGIASPAPSAREESPPATASATAAATAALPTLTPTPSQSPSPAPQPVTYVVQPGDTLNGIALHFGTTVAAIQQANGLASSDVILAGQVLVIP